MRSYGDIDSKFRFVILASKRAKQLLKGEKPKTKSKSKNLIRVAEEEVRKGLVDYEVLKPEDEREQKREESAEEKTEEVEKKEEKETSEEPAKKEKIKS